MKTIPIHPLWGQNQSSSFRAYGSHANLNQLVANMIRSSLPKAIEHNTSIVNKVGTDISLSADMVSIASIIEELLAVIVSNSKDGNIHISADRYRDVIILQLQERNNFNGYALASRIAAMGADAALLGGHISIAEPQRKIATINFSFPYQLQVA